MEKDLSFRHLIKTFVPGLFASLSLVLIFDLLVTKLINHEAHELIKAFVEKNSTLVVSLFIPISLFVGIVVNTICFMYLIPLILKKHEEKNKQFSEFSKFKKSMTEHLNVYYYKHLYNENLNVEYNEFKTHFDVYAFLLHRKNMASLQYIKTGYWYYLEFQLNSIIAIVLGIIAIDLNLFFRKIAHIDLSMKFMILLCTLVIGSILCFILYKAIIKNLERDSKKELSYILGAYHICRAGNSPI